MVRRADRIEVTLSLDDIATRELRQFVTGAERGGRRAERSFDRVDRSVDKTRAGLGRLAIGIGAAFAAFDAGRRAVGAGFGFVDAASDFEEAFSKFSVVFDAEADRVLGRIDEFTEAAGRSRAEFVNFTSGFQDLLVPLGFARGEAADLSVALTELAVDVGSFSNRLDTDVVRDFESALVGNSETVRKYGANLLESEVAQEAVRIGLSETGKELTQQEKVLARVSLLFKSTTDAQGDAIRTSDSYANSVKRLQAGISQLRVEIGGELINALQDATRELGGTDSLLADIEVGFRAAAIVTRGFIEVGASLIRALRELITDLGGGEAALQSFGQFVNRGVLALDDFLSLVQFLGDISAASFEALALSAGKSFNELVGVAEVAVDALNDLRDFLQGTTTADADFGFREDLRELSFADIVEQAADETEAALDEYGVRVIRARERFDERAAGFANLGTPRRGSGVDPRTLIPSQADLEGQLAGLSATSRGDNRFGAPEEGIGSRIAGILADIGSQLGSGDSGLAAVTGETNELSKAAEDLAETSGITLTEAFSRFGGALADAGFAVADFVQDELALAESGFAGAEVAVKNYAASLSDFQLAQDTTNQLFGAFESGIRDLSSDLVRGQADFSSFAQSLIQDIGAIITQFLLLRTIRSGLGITEGGGLSGGGLLSLFGFAQGGVIQGGTSQSVPFRAYANGGITNGPEIALMGEGRRNEAIVPLPNNRSIPVEFPGGGPGGNTSITFNVNAFDAKGARDAIIEQAKTIEEIVVTGIESGRNRKLSQSIRGASGGGR